MERQRDESRLLYHDELSQESQHANSNDEDESLPDVNLSRGRSLVIICILFFELFERLTFYGVAANLIFYCEDVLNLTPPLPSIIALAFQGTCFFTPIYGGWIADVKLGRYNTVFGSALLYIVGTIALTLTTYDEYPPGYAMSISSKKGFLAVSLILIAIGTGGIKANVSPMGADQVEHEGPEMVQKFFDWFYWFIQIGAILAFTVVAYIQQIFSFFNGYLITVISMNLATILLLVGRNYYIIPSPEGSYTVDIIKIIAGGLKKKLCGDKSRFRNHWLDGAKVTKGGHFPDSKVEGVKCVVRLIPIFLTFVFYWALFGQGLTTYVLQGSYMNLKVANNFLFPVASLNLFEVATLLLLIPLMGRVIFPILARLGVEFTPLRRIGVGMLFACSSVALAGIIEIERKHILKTDGGINQTVIYNYTTINASHMSVFWQVPQYILQGTSEVLVSVTGLEFAYSQSPPELRGVVMGLNLAMIGLGYFLASALASIVKKASDGHWYPKNLNDGTLEYYMFLLAGLMLMNTTVFLILAVSYRYADHEYRVQERNRLQSAVDASYSDKEED
ncbi:solute carrier family 15 member 4-like [Acropora muricata]|uniref:solute carrier family 15 member 4-like n=1 Tax=Acropora muricata TaxID=159855 RepID=UPI0034E4244D